MVRNIFGTLSSKVLTNLINFAILILQTQFLGAEGRGEISLLIINITLIQHLNDIIGGGAVVYLAPRLKTGEILWPSYLWAIVTAIGGSSILFLLNQCTVELWIHISILSVLFSVFSIHLKYFIGKERIGLFNGLSVLQVIVTLLPFLILVYLFDRRDYGAFIESLYIAYGICFVLSTIIVISIYKAEWFKASFKQIKTVIRYGFSAQISNILNFFNYRLSYYLLIAYVGKAELGVYSTAVIPLEGLWMISRSIALVQYSKTVNITDDEASSKLASRLTKLSFWILLVGVVVMAIIPQSVYTWVFGAEFETLKQSLYPLLPGTLIFGFSMTIAPFFSGTGRFSVNNIAALFGLICITVFGFWLIPLYGTLGAGIATSITYTASTAYVYYKYKQYSSFQLMHLFDVKTEIKLLRSKLFSS